MRAGRFVAKTYPTKTTLLQMAAKQDQRISGELNSVSVQGRSAITQALASYNSGGYDVRIQVRPRQLRRRGMAPSPYQTLYLNPEDQEEALAEEKVAAAREQKLLQEAQARGETTVRIGQEHVCPTYVLTGLEQTQDAPGLQVPLGETASAGHRARRMDLEQALREVGYDLDMERERRRAMDAIPIAWSQDAKHVLIGDGNLGAFGQNGYLSRSTASIGLPGDPAHPAAGLAASPVQVLPQSRHVRARGRRSRLAQDASSKLKQHDSPDPARLTGVVDATVGQTGERGTTRGSACGGDALTTDVGRPAGETGRGFRHTLLGRWWKICSTGASCLCRMELPCWHQKIRGRYQE